MINWILTNCMGLGKKMSFSWKLLKCIYSVLEKSSSFESDLLNGNTGVCVRNIHLISAVLVVTGQMGCSVWAGVIIIICGKSWLSNWTTSLQLFNVKLTVCWTSNQSWIRWTGYNHDAVADKSSRARSLLHKRAVRLVAWLDAMHVTAEIRTIIANWTWKYN